MSDSDIREILKTVYAASTDPRLSQLERDVVQDFAGELQLGLHTMEQTYEDHKGENLTVREYFYASLQRILAVPARLQSQMVGPHALGFMNKAWEITLQAVERFVEAHKEKLQIDSWSIGATFGFPVGVSGTISVTFK